MRTPPPPPPPLPPSPLSLPATPTGQSLARGVNNTESTIWEGLYRVHGGCEHALLRERRMQCTRADTRGVAQGAREGIGL